MQTSCNFKSHYYQLILLSINFNDNPSNQNNYEYMKVITQNVPLLFPGMSIVHTDLY